MNIPTLETQKFYFNFNRFQTEFEFCAKKRQRKGGSSGSRLKKTRRRSEGGEVPVALAPDVQFVPASREAMRWGRRKQEGGRGSVHPYRSTPLRHVSSYYLHFFVYSVPSFPIFHSFYIFPVPFDFTFLSYSLHPILFFVISFSSVLRFHSKIFRAIDSCVQTTTRQNCFQTHQQNP